MIYTPHYLFNAHLHRVVDADTVVLRPDLTHRIDPRITYRLLGINAPEPRGETRAAGEAATDHLEHLLHCSTELLVRTVPDARSFDRYVAVLFGVIEGVLQTINLRMVHDGHAIAVPAWGWHDLLMIDAEVRVMLNAAFGTSA